MSSHTRGASLATALGAIAEGVSFYDMAHLAVADVRVKVALEDLGRRKKAQLARLETLAGPDAAAAAPRPMIYPLEVVARVECYVCGHSLETTAMPDQCPKCGAARYSFEKEISLAKAWEIAGDASRRSAALFRELAAKDSGEARSLLETLAREEDQLAAEAEKQRAELVT